MTTDTSTTSVNTTQEETPSILPPPITQRQSKYVRSQTTLEPKTAPSKAYITRRTRGKASL